MIGEGTATIDIEIVKEAFYCTFSGQGELWFPYKDKDESQRREYVDTYWDDFLECIQEARGENK